MEAASRYSEVKLADISIDMMKDFDKNIVDFIDNYDGTIKMPEVMPVKFPAFLLMLNPELVLVLLQIHHRLILQNYVNLL